VCGLRFVTVVVVLAAVLTGCAASVPREIALVQEKELGIINSLHQSHLAMIDAYVDQKKLAFEDFFFTEYGPAYLTHWKSNFRTLKNREYDEQRDFGLLYNDLVAEYLDQAAPIEDVRTQLRDAIIREHENVVLAHESVTRWLSSLEKLNAAQREMLNSMLGAVKPGLSLDLVDQAVDQAKQKVNEAKKKLNL
jgi:hypothetical protein